MKIAALDEDVDHGRGFGLCDLPEELRRSLWHVLDRGQRVGDGIIFCIRADRPVVLPEFEGWECDIEVVLRLVLDLYKLVFVALRFGDLKEGFVKCEGVVGFDPCGVEAVEGDAVGVGVGDDESVIENEIVIRGCHFYVVGFLFAERLDRNNGSQIGWNAFVVTLFTPGGIVSFLVAIAAQPCVVRRLVVSPIEVAVVNFKSYIMRIWQFTISTRFVFGNALFSVLVVDNSISRRICLKTFLTFYRNI